jgi:hypothetical protein
VVRIQGKGWSLAGHLSSIQNLADLLGGARQGDDAVYLHTSTPTESAGYGMVSKGAMATLGMLCGCHLALAVPTWVRQ